MEQMATKHHQSELKCHVNLLLFRSLRVLLLLKKKLKKDERDGGGNRCCIYSFHSLCSSCVLHCETLLEKSQIQTTCPDEPVCFPPAVALSCADRCEGRYCLSSATWLTSVTPFTGCRPASCGRDNSPTGWWDWWAPSRLWLVWSRWATVTRQTVDSLHLTVRNRSGALMTEQMMRISGKRSVKGHVADL